MPSPSKLSMLTGVIFTAGLFAGGAWLASGMVSESDYPEQGYKANYDYSDSDRQINDWNDWPKPAPVKSTAPVKPEVETVKATREVAAPAISQTEPQASKATQKAAPEGIKVSIEGIRNNSGKIYIFVFGDEASYNRFNYMKTVDYAEIPARSGTIRHDFSYLTEGRYAISLFHDENGNEEFDMAHGYPAEGYATSGAKDAYDEPSFKEASVGQGQVTLQMHYLQ